MAENEEIKEARPEKMENVVNGPDDAVTAVVESSTESTAAVPKQEAEVAPLVIKTPGMEGVDKIVIKRANSAPLTIEESTVHPLSPRAEAERKKKSPDRSTSMSDASHSQLSAQTTPAPNQEAFDEFINSPQGQNVIVERSPGGRYVRFMEKLGSGATKDVYRAYDTTEGIEVAWNVVNLAGVPKPERNRIVNEVRLLERLHHPNIISFHGSWVNREKQEVNFVTEILSSGTLKNFIDKVQVIRWKIAKRWAFQILNGLDYLHSQDPPVIHRDLKCDNIFINGTSGDLRIGDLGLSTVHRHGKVLSVLGTPEFMAPDLYEEAAYDEKVDVYAFGMVLLEILTKEIPYKECTNPAQIYKKVMSGIPPESLGRLRSKKARDYVLLCLGQKDEATGKYVRPSTSELLQHPFLGPGPDDEAEVEVDPPLQHRTIAEEGEARSGGDQASDGLGSTGSIDAVAEATTSPDAAAVAGRQSRYSDGSSLNQDDSDHFEEMPDSEVNIRRVKVMMGRGQELAEEESQAPQLHESVRSVESLTDAQESLRSINPMASLQESNRSVDSLKSSGQGATTTKPPADGQGDSVEGGNKTGEDGRANLCVAAAVVHDESPLVRPYDDDILKLIIRLPVDGQTQNVQFDFHLVNDDAIQVAREMVAELDIPETAVLEISETISGLAKNARMKQAKYVQRQQQWQKEQMQPQHQQQSGSVANQQQQPPQSSQQQYNQPLNHGMQQSMPTEGLAQQQMPQQQQAPMSQTVGQGMHLSEGFQQQQQPGMVQQLPQHQPPQHQGELYQPQHQPGVPMQQHLPGSQPLNGGAHQAGYVQGQAPSQPPGMMNQQQIAQAAQGQGGGGMQQGPGTALPQSHQMSQQHPPPSQNQFHLQNQGQAMQTIPPGQSQVPPQRPTADPHATMQYSAPAQGQMEYQNASQQQFQQSAAPLQGQTDYPSPLTPALAPPQGEYQQVAQQQFQAVQHGQAADYQGAPAPPPPPPPPPPQPPVALEYPSLGQNGHHGYPLDAPDYQQKQPPLHPGTAASEGMYTASPPPPRLYQAAAGANSSAASLGTSLSSFGDSRPNSRSASVSSVSLRDELEETEGETDEVSEDDEVVDSNVSEEGSEVEEELRRLEEDFQKNLLRAQKVFDSRMDNLQRSKEEKEAQHLKTLEKHEKEKAEFEKRVRQAEKEQSRRIEQLQREWDRKREKLAMHKKKHGESISAPNSPAHEQRHDSSRSPPPVPSSKAEQAVENDVLP